MIVSTASSFCDCSSLIPLHRPLHRQIPRREGAIPVVFISVLYLVAHSIKYKAIRACILVKGQDFTIPPIHEDGFVGNSFCEGGGGKGVAESPADLRMEG